MLPCPYNQLLGISCPFCGFQRSFLALLHGDVVACLKLYPAMLPLLLALAVAPIVKRDNRRKYYTWALAVFGTVAIIGCVLKNVGLLPA